MSNLFNPFVSVVIPVFNDSERLKICLEALENQTYPKNLYEVIVVDNASTENIDKVVEPFKQAFTTYEGKPGSYAARNKGISIAKGEVLAFTDSDCIPVHNWLETGVKHLLSVLNCGLVGGEIELFFKDQNHPTAVELFDSVTFLQQKKFIEEENYGVTANLFTFKKIFEKVGSFNSQLKSGGDKEWGKRVVAHGYSLFYASDTKIKHPARSSLNQIYTKTTRISGGKYTLNNQNNNKVKYIAQLIQNVLFVFRPPIRSGLKKSYLEPRLNTNNQKFQVYVVTLLVHYFKLFEEIRLQLGGSPKR